PSPSTCVCSTPSSWMSGSTGRTRLKSWGETWRTSSARRRSVSTVSMKAFLHERSIDRQTYERQRDQLREQLALAEIELNDAVLDQLDIDGVLAFAEHVVTNAARLWIELDLIQKQRLQQVVFPEGLRFDGVEFGTAVTCLAFKKL